jgi:multisubunit Na+/H+ antiporter MnhE subunit
MILIVDDQVGLRKLVEDFLYQLALLWKITAANGQVALLTLCTKNLT